MFGKKGELSNYALVLTLGIVMFTLGLVLGIEFYKEFDSTYSNTFDNDEEAGMWRITKLLPPILFIFGGFTLVGVGAYGMYKSV